MRTLRFRLIGPDERMNALLASLAELDDVDRIEEVADELGAHLRDDSSSLGLEDDTPADFRDIEVHAFSAEAAQAARDRIELAARELDLVVEFVDEF
ncbi:MAG TPA: hypothetical protein VGC30_07410 [Dokdonella sp.]